MFIVFRNRGMYRISSNRCRGVIIDFLSISYLMEKCYFRYERLFNECKLVVALAVGLVPFPVGPLRLLVRMIE